MSDEQSSTVTTTARHMDSGDYTWGAGGGLADIPPVSRGYERSVMYGTMSDGEVSGYVMERYDSRTCAERHEVRAKYLEAEVGRLMGAVTTMAIKHAEAVRRIAELERTLERMTADS